ncbi:MAG: peptide ABC transporter substrate-binding protein [Blastocatellia bacterium]|nr:peptide ABC transporter substrate-binding protein [Blastocatellia bacterium]
MSISRANRTFGAVSFSIAAFASAFLFGCSQIKSPEPSPFYAKSKPPTVQELRWSNGPRPKTLDPARASAAPETDIARALYEGLTEIDPRSLAEIPAVAESWSHDDAFRVWTFRLRENARWSNGQAVTANDFITSWRRAVDLGAKAPNRHLLRNIVGLSVTETKDSGVDYDRTEAAALGEPSAPDEEEVISEEREISPPLQKVSGLDAIDERTLRVRLESADKDFPKLVANVIFRPVFGEGKIFATNPVPTNLVTNGAFVVGSSGATTFLLKRSERYWNMDNVSLERVRFVPFDSAESALSAYKNGDIDAVTNAEFEPLALKLLEPFQDFRQTRYGALNFYEINTENAPFNDRRVREALSVSIDRERVAQNELEGAARPAVSFLPLGRKIKTPIAFDVKRARSLLAAAGFPNGENFPRVRLVINRNDTQQRVARSIARMWKQNLNIDTDTLVKDPAEFNAARTALDYDIVRRGVVLPTLNEAASLEAIFGRTARVPSEATTVLARTAQPGVENYGADNLTGEDVDHAESGDTLTEVFTEEDALYQMNAIPLYFPTSYSLVKPYVEDFEINGTDAPLLSTVKINNKWLAE